jgi:glucose-1-phosphate cytidylyltransferase
MKTVILCGGKGTRLREHTVSLPKPLVEVGSHPILWHLMKSYSAQGFGEFVLCLGYQGDAIKNYFLDLMDGKSGDFRLRPGEGGRPQVDVLKPMADAWDIIFAETGPDTETGGRLHRVRPYVDGGTFMLTYGDGLSDVDLHALLAFHRAHGKLATVTAVRPRSTLGLLQLDDEGCVTSFAEKPVMHSLVNGGFFVFEPGVFDYTQASCILEKDVLPRVAAARQLVAYEHSGFWACMDTYKDQLTLTEIWNQGKAPWRRW